MPGMKLRVKPVVHLPHRVVKGETYIFTPDCTVPEKLGKALLATYPNLYEVAKGTANVEEYTFKQSFKDESIQTIFSKLSEDGQVELFDFAQKLLKKEQDEIGSVDKDAEAKKLADARKKQVDELAERKKDEEEAERSKKSEEEARARAGSSSPE